MNIPRTITSSLNYAKETIKYKYEDAMYVVSPSRKVLKKYKRILKKITPSDGLDELAVAAISYLPTVARPPVTAASLLFLTPFVREGGRAMAAEYQETLNTVKQLEDKGLDLQLKILSNPAFKNLLDKKDNLPKDLKETLEKISDYKGSNQKQIDTFMKADEYLNVLSKNPTKKQTEDINNFINSITKQNFTLSHSDASDLLISIKDNIVDKLNIKNPTLNDSDTLLDDLVKYQHNQADLKLANYPQTMKAGTFAMGGMTAGVFTGALQALSETAQQIGFKPEMMNATQNALGLVTQAIFIPSQAAMAVFGVNEAFKGFAKNTHLEEQKQALNDYAKDNPNHKEIIEEATNHINALKRNNMVGDIAYGLGTAAAEIGMIAGGLMGSSSILFPASVATLGFSVLRMVADNQKAKLTGDAHDHDHNGDIIQMLWNPQTEKLDTNKNNSGHVHSSSCNHGSQDRAFEPDINELKKQFTIQNGQLSKTLYRKDNVNAKNYNEFAVNEGKTTLFNTLSIPEQFDLNKEVIKDKNFKKYDFVYANAIMNNEKASERAIDMLIKGLTKEPRPQTKATTEALDILNADNPILHDATARQLMIDVLKQEFPENHRWYTVLNSENPDLKTLERIFTKYEYVLDDPKHKKAKETIERVLSNNLQKIFTENMAILDKPENAKKIMPLLLADRLKTIKKDKVSLMNNLIHLAQKAKLQESFKPQQTKEIN